MFLNITENLLLIIILSPEDLDFIRTLCTFNASCFQIVFWQKLYFSQRQLKSADKSGNMINKYIS